MLSELVLQKFQELFNEKPLLVRSPGRVNLIGEHTDYNEGFVLPAAIDKAIYFAISPRDNEKCSLFALDMNDSFQFSVNSLQFSEKHWPNYLMGVVDQILRMGYNLKGFNCVFGGDIPIGAGMSSSAAIEAGLAFALNHIFNLGIDKITLVKLAQKAENEFVGVQCGIMDQYINIFGKYGNVLRIDCRSLEYDYFPFEYKEISIVLFDTGVSHSLASSEYNQRRKECTLGVELIKKDHSQIKSLRDVTLVMLNDYKNKLDSKIFRRCKYVVEENDRIMKACYSLKEKNLSEFGSFMYSTHEGLSKDYEVSCQELNYLVELTVDNPGVYGSRMMGGGFGGCTINLIENNIVEETKEKFSKKYKQKFNIDLKTYITSISNGTSVIELN
ncbi:MAG: galactokinase [Melioribacteraceae bacterium]